MGCTRVLDEIFVTGEIPRINTYEDSGGAFYLDADGTRPDPLFDDQALVIDLGRRVVLLLGCAHAGVVNTLDHVQASDRPKTGVRRDWRTTFEFCR